MKNRGKRTLTAGVALIVLFVLWTLLILRVDVQPVGQNGTNIGFATLNVWFHHLTGVHMGIYTLTDCLELIAIAVCIGFGVLGLVQLFRRRSLWKVDRDILLLGGYYLLVILAYLIFERIPINYRPILIDGVMEVSYPSSTTLLVLSVMPTLKFQVDKRSRNTVVKGITTAFVVLFSVFMLFARLVSGVHWFTDIIGAVILSAGLYLVYRSAVILLEQRKNKDANNL